MPEVELDLHIGPDLDEVRRVKKRESDWAHLPYEIWLIILVDYGLTSKDFLQLDYCCKWFNSSWRGTHFVIPAQTSEHAQK